MDRASTAMPDRSSRVWRIALIVVLLIQAHVLVVARGFHELLDDFGVSSIAMSWASFVGSPAFMSGGLAVGVTILAISLIRRGLWRYVFFAYAGAVVALCLTPWLLWLISW